MTPPSPWSSAGSGRDRLDTGDNIPKSLVAGRLKLCACLCLPDVAPSNDCSRCQSSAEVPAALLRSARPGGGNGDGPSVSSTSKSTWGGSPAACGLSSETVSVPEAMCAAHGWHPSPTGVMLGPHFTDREVGSQTAAGSYWNQPQTQ